MYSKYRNNNYISILSPSNDLYKLFQDARDAARHSINCGGLNLHAIMPTEALEMDKGRHYNVKACAWDEKKQYKPP